MDPDIDTPLTRAILHHLQQQDMSALTDPNATERLLTEAVGSHEEVFYVAVQRAILMSKMLEEKGIPVSQHHTGAMVGIWLEGFLTGVQVANDESEVAP